MPVRGSHYRVRPGILDVEPSENWADPSGLRRAAKKRGLHFVVAGVFYPFSDIYAGNNPGRTDIGVYIQR